MLVNCTNDIKTNILFLVSHSCYRYHTTFKSDGEKQSITYLKHHDVNCGLNRIIQSVKLERNTGGNKIRYNYICCEIPCPCNQHSIRRGNFTDYEDGNTAALYNQNVQCSDHDFITGFNLSHQSNSSKIRYMYKCCNISGRNKASYSAQTPLNNNGGGRVIYLDRHNISCENGYGVTKFHLIESNQKIQYNFSCTKILTTCGEQGKWRL